jgi:hypothetical protein
VGKDERVLRRTGSGLQAQSCIVSGICIQGCTFGTSLKADHKCHNKCGRAVHNLYAQANDLRDEDNDKRSNK